MKDAYTQIMSNLGEPVGHYNLCEPPDRRYIRRYKRRVFPYTCDWYRAIELCPLDTTKVVILGQDPYPHEGADGLAFSNGTRNPNNKSTSLINIFKELRDDLGINNFDSMGELDYWAEQGVLLLNSALTVVEGRPGAHLKYWEPYTDSIISELSRNHDGLVYMLWGRHAKNKQHLIDQDRHLVLLANHPAQPSQYDQFSGCKHFRTCNQYLIEINQDPIDWSL